MAEEKKESKVKEFMEIGGSPVPGITLRQVLRGHTNEISRIAWSPDGRYLASPSEDKTVRIWDVERGECVAILKGHEGKVRSVSWSYDGKKLASSSDDKTIRIWNSDKWNQTHLLKHKATVGNSIWSPNHRLLVSGDDDGKLRIWDTSTWKLKHEISEHEGNIYCLVWSPNGKTVISGGADKIIRIWNTQSWQVEQKLTGHQDYIEIVAWSPDNTILASAGGTNDRLIRIWDVKNGLQIIGLEGHTSYIRNLSFSSDGHLFASKACDDAVKIWNTANWQRLIDLSESGLITNEIGLAFHPTTSRLSTLGERNTSIRIWDLDYNILIGNVSIGESVRYTTAKLVLVGDSGVGKTGLGWRLAHDEFKEHSSTHGQQFWVVPELKKTRKDGTECEAVLWDLAGQHIYRSIHSIFLDDVDASLVLFDPTNRQEPLKGAQFWLEQLKGKKQLPPSVLVGARLDRGAPVLSQQELDQFCQKYRISGGYIGTSAKSGEGLDTLLESLKNQIPWDQMTTTVTTVTFKKIKDYVLTLKEKTDRKGVLVHPEELRVQLQATDKDWQFTDAEMMTAVGHLANHGYVSILHSSAGEQFVLLVPELLASVASSIFLHADKHPRELGAINETDLLQGKYPIDEFKGLEKEEQQVLLDATVVRFLEHSLCFRETLGNDNLLIFPSLIKQKRPLKDDVPATDDISYIVRGRVENIYASLVVLLGYTSSFTRINQWANQAQYETDKGNICGFRLVEDREGEIEFILYYGNEMDKDEGNTFQTLFEQFLYQREVEVTPFPPVICPKGHRQERATVVKRLREGKKFLHCEECGEKTNLPSTEPRTIGIGASSWLQKEEAVARLRNVYETYLLRIKAYRRSWASPRCYISCVSEHLEFAERLKRDLKEAGVFIIEEASQVQKDDTVVLLDCPAYQNSWRAQSLDEDIGLVKLRLSTDKLISIVIEGKPIDAHDFKGCRPGDFCNESHYPVSLYNLVLNLYAIPLTHTGFAPLRASLHQQWGQSLSQFSSKLEPGKNMNKPLKVFISYSHKDEEFKDELVTMLASLQRRGIIDAWQDRRIEEGDEWYQEIQDAMNDSDLAILLVSANFLASRFIQDEELPKLFKRRMEGGMRVVPIIVKQCMWQSEPVIKDIQVMPRDGKPVITFAKDNGDRDQVWTDIAKAIEKRAK